MNWSHRSLFEAPHGGSNVFAHMRQPVDSDALYEALARDATIHALVLGASRLCGMDDTVATLPAMNPR
jgi:hypothetical protein